MKHSGELSIPLSRLVMFAGLAITVTTASWGFAVTAANYVIGPHIAAAKRKVAIMCILAQNQNDSMEAICAATGAVCPPKIDPEIIVESCKE